MARSQTTMYQMAHQNPGASKPLLIPVLVLCNTPDEELQHNVRVNSERPGPWVYFEAEKRKPLVICGGGPSLEENLLKVQELQASGADVWGLNGAATYLLNRNIKVNAQVIADAKPETASLIDSWAETHLFASQVNPLCFEKMPTARLWHLEGKDIEQCFPAERVKAGGYALICASAAVGDAACALSYVLGYRELHLFGYDSSHRDGYSHAYDQPMNRVIPTIEASWAGKTFISSLAMKAQAEKFMITGQLLKQAGVSINMYGDGLLPTMWNTPLADAAERDKYKLMWQHDAYRNHSPGEQIVDTFIDVVKPDGVILDFGCGTGRAALELTKRGHKVLAIDFADNCRDEEAIGVPFLEWDLTLPCPAVGNHGLCTDVMEHIPPKDVETVINNIMDAAPSVFFQISTVPDGFGAVIGTPLHLSVHSHYWWSNEFQRLGYEITWDREDEAASLFHVKRQHNGEN